MGVGGKVGGLIAIRSKLTADSSASYSPECNKQCGAYFGVLNLTAPVKFGLTNLTFRKKLKTAKT